MATARSAVSADGRFGVPLSFLYAAGMVLNDAFDATLDAKERPERPIPSGRISRATAFQAGFSLLVLGIALACFASWQLQSRTPAVVAALLAFAVIAYDAKLKKTEFGPSAMGICRYLNVLLGASVAGDLWLEPSAWIYAAAVGMYTIGLTLFARSENEPSKTRGQALGGLLTLGSMALVGTLPLTLSSGRKIPLRLVWLPVVDVSSPARFSSGNPTKSKPGSIPEARF